MKRILLILLLCPLFASRCYADDLFSQVETWSGAAQIETALPDEVKAAMAQTLDASIRQMAGAYALLDAGEWTRVLDSIFYDSLYGIGKAVLDGHYHRCYRMRRKRVTERQPV